MLDTQTLVILALIALIVGLILGIMIARPKYPSFPSTYSPPKSGDLAPLTGSQVVRKEIIWQLISNTLVSPAQNDEVKVTDKVQVLYNGKPVEDARLVILRIRNTGNVPVFSQDYENNNPIEFDFGEKATVLDTEILTTTPANMKEEVPFRQEEGKVLLGPLLLNSLDSITLKVLLIHFHGEIRVNARIAGVKQIRAYSS